MTSKAPRARECRRRHVHGVHRERRTMPPSPGPATCPG